MKKRRDFPANSYTVCWRLNFMTSLIYFNNTLWKWFNFLLYMHQAICKDHTESGAILTQWWKQCAGRHLKVCYLCVISLHINNENNKLDLYSAFHSKCQTLIKFLKSKMAKCPWCSFTNVRFLKTLNGL